MSRKKKRKTQEGVTLNLAAMLDMAFQLLAFFILTFRPSPVEAELATYLPPAVAMTNLVPRDLPTSGEGEGIVVDPKLEITVILEIHSDSQGHLAGVSEDGFGEIFIGGPTASNLFRLELRLRELFGYEGSPFEEVQLKTSPELRYDEFMRILDVCLRQKLGNGKPLEKIGFVELTPEGGAAPPATGM